MDLRRIDRILLLLLVALGLAACGGGGGAGEPGLPALQTLTSVTPDRGSTAGGTTVELRGRGFLDEQHPILGVRIGDTTITAWEVVNDGTIRFVTPPGPLGPATIWLIGEDSMRQDGAVLAGGFEYVAPTLLVADGVGAVNPQLYRVDLETQGLSVVGPIGYALEGMALAPDGMLYGVESVSPYRLIRVDPVSAQGEAFALLRDGAGAPVEIRDVTMLDGRLLGRTAAGGLVEIDRGTGLVTPVSALAGALAGDGVAELGGLLYLAPSQDPSQLAVFHPEADVLSPGAVLAPSVLLEACVGLDGRLFAIDGNPPVPVGRALFRIDPVTGAVEGAAVLPPHASAIARDR